MGSGELQGDPGVTVADVALARAQLLGEPDWLLEQGPTVHPLYLRPSPPPPADPLPVELRCRLDAARDAFQSLC